MREKSIEKWGGDQLDSTLLSELQFLKSEFLGKRNIMELYRNAVNKVLHSKTEPASPISEIKDKSPISKLLSKLAVTVKSLVNLAFTLNNQNKLSLWFFDLSEEVVRPLSKLGISWKDFDRYFTALLQAIPFIFPTTGPTFSPSLSSLTSTTPASSSSSSSSLTVPSSAMQSGSASPSSSSSTTTSTTLANTVAPVTFVILSSSSSPPGPISSTSTSVLSSTSSSSTAPPVVSHSAHSLYVPEESVAGIQASPPQFNSSFFGHDHSRILSLWTRYLAVIAPVCIVLYKRHWEEMEIKQIGASPRHSLPGYQNPLSTSGMGSTGGTTLLAGVPEGRVLDGHGTGSTEGTPSSSMIEEKASPRKG